MALPRSLTAVARAIAAPALSPVLRHSAASQLGVPDRSNTARIAKRRQCRAERRG
jgi:hypothetical protein